MELQALGLVDRGEVDCLGVVGRISRRFGVDVADEGELGEKFVRVLELAGEAGELVEVFLAQLVVGEIGFRVVVVNRLDDRP